MFVDLPNPIRQLIEKSTLSLAADLDFGLMNPDHPLAGVIIDDEGLDHHNVPHDELMSHWFDTEQGKRVTVKLERLEHFNEDLKQLSQTIQEHYGSYVPVTIHLFKALKGSPSFPVHADPTTVMLIPVYGRLTVGFLGRHPKTGTLVSEGQVTLTKGDVVVIPPNQLHYALNEHSSLVLSLGIEEPQ